jgi:hypothetical protein
MLRNSQRVVTNISEKLQPNLPILQDEMSELGLLLYLTFLIFARGCYYDKNLLNRLNRKTGE